jgi:transposase InsO family protein
MLVRAGSSASSRLARHTPALCSTRWNRRCKIAGRFIVVGSYIAATGGQYVSAKYTERLAEAGVRPSVGSVDDSHDNALAETINGFYEAKVIHRRADHGEASRQSS